MLFGRLFQKRIKREEVLEQLREEVKKLQEKKIVSLMREGKINELEKIAQDIKISNLKKFVKEQNKLLELLVEEIPPNALIETIFYLSRSGCNNTWIFDDFSDFYFCLISDREEICSNLVDILGTKEVCELETKDFMM